MKKTWKNFIRKSTIFVHKYTHLVLFHSEKILSAIAKKIVLLFFKMFPEAHFAFKKRDHLEGIKNGPSSFFLKRISEHKEKKRLHKK